MENVWNLYHARNFLQWVSLIEMSLTLSSLEQNRTTTPMNTVFTIWDWVVVFHEYLSTSPFQLIMMPWRAQKSYWWYQKFIHSMNLVWQEMFSSSIHPFKLMILQVTNHSKCKLLWRSAHTQLVPYCISWNLYWKVGRGELHWDFGIVTLYTALHTFIRISFSNGIKGFPQASHLLKRAMEEE